MLLPLALDLEVDETGEHVLPAELANYKISYEFLFNLISGNSWGDSGCCFLLELVYRLNNAQFGTPIPVMSKSAKECSADGYVDIPSLGENHA